MNSRNNESGVVSIFVVIFSALLVTIVTVSFVSLMLRNQQQANNAELSNNARDAALAGVEDAKRLLLIYRDCQRRDDETSLSCSRAISAINDSDRLCNTVKRGLYGGDVNNFDEVLVQRDQDNSDGASTALDQAYTCVKIRYLSTNLKGTVGDGGSQLLPIETNGNAFNKIKISWFKRAQGASDTLNVTPDPIFAPTGYDGQTLPLKDSWPANRPPILRTQIIQTAETFSSGSFDEDDGDESNTNTLFLYPLAGDGASTIAGYPFPTDNRSGINSPKRPSIVGCSETNYLNGTYGCQVTIDIPSAIGGDGGRTNFFLQLGALYNATDFNIELLNGADPVEIVSPVVDSTGRANDLFRRVEAYVNFAGEYPRAGIDIDGNLCKDFSVTDKTADYKSNPDCDPAEDTL